MKTVTTDNRVPVLAWLAHEVNRGLCRAIGDPVAAPWNDLDYETQLSTMRGVIYALSRGGDVTPEAMHDNWIAERTAHGWTYGERLDRAAKTHPNLVRYNALPLIQQLKDAIFLAVVRHGAALLSGDLRIVAKAGPPTA